MPHSTRERLGSTNYYGYQSLSEAFFDLPETAQAIYMTMIVGRVGAPGESPIVAVDLNAYGQALKRSAQDVYHLMSIVTGIVLISTLENGQRSYTNLAASIQEVFTSDGDPSVLMLLLPITPEHEALMAQVDDIVLDMGGDA